MNHPMITVLMPNHNGGPYIAASIQSVLDQTFTDFELLIVEDASTDNSLAVIQSFDDPRIRVLQLEQNEHICLGLNLGLREARGKYIARLDSDDCWYPEKLEKQIAYMETHPECGASFTWVNVVDEQDRRLTAEESRFVTLFHVHNRPRTEWVRHFYFEGSCLCHPSAVIPMSVMQELGGYDNALVQIQDYDLWARIAKRYELYVLEEPLMNYRHALQGGNVSAISPTTSIRSYYEFSYVLRHYFDDLSDEALVASFRDDFKRKDASGHAELQCERALLLLKTVFCGNAPKTAGMDLLAKLLNNEETRLILREQYEVTQMNFYQLSASPSLAMEDPDLATRNIGRKTLFRLLVKRTLQRHPRLYRFIQRLRNKKVS